MERLSPRLVLALIMDSDNTITTDITTYLLSSVHDMKNSLGVMVATLEGLISEVPPLPQKARLPLARTLHESQRLNDRLIQLLSLYKINHGFYPFDPADHDVDEFVSEVIAQALPMAQAGNIVLISECPQGISGFFDRELIFGIMLHALHNAIHYTHKQVCLAAQMHDGQLQLRIEDDGKGYPATMLDAPLSPEGEIDFCSGSTKLGIYFSSVAAQLHRHGERKGSIRLENGGRFGGSCFVLTLP